MRTIISLFAATVIASPLSQAQAQDDPVDWTITPAKAASTAQAGSIVPITLKAKIEDGWHIYSITQPSGGPQATKITVPTDQPFTLSGTIKSTRPAVEYDQNFGIDVETHENEVTFTVPVRVEKTAKNGVNSLQINARYQVCNASICIPARTEKLKLSLNVKGGNGTFKAPSAAPSTPADKKS